MRDPLFEIKWTKLRERLQEHPERPLILVLGSSRPAAGIRPELWQEHSASDQSPMVFNFAMAGVGPRQQLIYLRRLLSAGIRPSGVLIEILPASLNQSGHASEDQMIKKRGLEAEELAILNGSLSPAPSPDSQPSSEWGSHWSSLRLRMLRRFAPAWVETDVSSNASPKQFSPWGWRPFAKGVQVASAEEYRRGIERSRAEFEYRLVNWEVTEIADRAVRQMLNDCRREHIRTALYLMPEATAFQKNVSARGANQTQGLSGEPLTRRRHLCARCDRVERGSRFLRRASSTCGRSHSLHPTIRSGIRRSLCNQLERCAQA